ncbi:hypothetical protein [Streptomyces sp. ISL-43]|nr:hypothetical protein [Streptomyces sp. ISL-43]
MAAAALVGATFGMYGPWDLLLNLVAEVVALDLLFLILDLA